jgi:competence protein ComEA
MITKIITALFALMASVAFSIAMAAVDVNKATPAELDTIAGIGPAIAGKISEERKNGAFKSWQDLIDRVKGIGEGNAAKLSAAGLTVNGSSFAGAPAAAPAAKAAAKDAKAAATAETTKVAAPVAAAASKATGDAKADAKAAAQAAKDEKKAAKAAAAEAAAKAKADKAAAKQAAKDAKAAAAASAPKK